MKFLKLLNVPVYRQDTEMSCWYASANMVLHSFVQGPSFGMGDKNAKLFQTGLPNSLFKDFAVKQGLRCMEKSEDEIMGRASSYSNGCPGLTFQNLVYMLNRWGPIWTVIKADSHAVVTVGVVEDDKAKTEVLYHDPATGISTRMSLDRFNDTVSWLTPGVMLHYPNGSAAPHMYMSVQLDVLTTNKGL